MINPDETLPSDETKMFMTGGAPATAINGISDFATCGVEMRVP